MARQTNYGGGGGWIYPDLPEYKYILKYRKPVPCSDTQKWAQWFMRAHRRVRRTQVNKGYVSTVFLGLDHNFGGGPPILFETMYFGEKGISPESEDGFWGTMTRASTWREALRQHWAMVGKIKLENL